MKNTTKLRHILQLYTVTLDVDGEDNFRLTMVSKKNNSYCEFIDKSYTVVMAKAFSHMKSELKKEFKL